MLFIIHYKSLLTKCICRPNTGQQVKQETLGELRKKYKKVTWKVLTPQKSQGFCCCWFHLTSGVCWGVWGALAEAVWQQCQDLQPRLLEGEKPTLMMSCSVWAVDAVGCTSFGLHFRATARTRWEGWSARLGSGGKPTTSSQVCASIFYGWIIMHGLTFWHITTLQGLSWVFGLWWSLSWPMTVRRKGSTPKCRLVF